MRQATVSLQNAAMRILDAHNVVDVASTPYSRASLRPGECQPQPPSRQRHKRSILSIYLTGGNLHMTDLICAIMLSWSAHAGLSSLLLPYSLLLTSFPYTASASSPVISNLTDEDRYWAIAVRKGTTYFDYMETGCYPDKSNPLDKDDLEALGWQISWPPKLGRFDTQWIDGDAFEKFGWMDPEEGAFWSNEVRRDCESLSLLLPSSSGGPPYDVIIRCFASRLPPRRILLALNQLLLPRQESWWLHNIHNRIFSIERHAILHQLNKKEGGDCILVRRFLRNVASCHLSNSDQHQAPSLYWTYWR